MDARDCLYKWVVPSHVLEHCTFYMSHECFESNTPGSRHQFVSKDGNVWKRQRRHAKCGVLGGSRNVVGSHQVNRPFIQKHLFIQEWKQANYVNFAYHFTQLNRQTMQCWGNGETDAFLHRDQCIDQRWRLSCVCLHLNLIYLLYVKRLQTLTPYCCLKFIERTGSWGIYCVTPRIKLKAGLQIKGLYSFNNNAH